MRRTTNATRNSSSHRSIDAITIFRELILSASTRRILSAEYGLVNMHWYPPFSPPRWQRWPTHRRKKSIESNKSNTFRALDSRPTTRPSAIDLCFCYYASALCNVRAGTRIFLTLLIIFIVEIIYMSSYDFRYLFVVCKHTFPWIPIEKHRTSSEHQQIFFIYFYLSSSFFSFVVLLISSRSRQTSTNRCSDGLQIQCK